MDIYKQWTETVNDPNNKDFFMNYLDSEKVVYASILSNKQSNITGVLSELAEKVSMDTITFVGFLDGINTSLEQPLDLESLTEDSEISLSINFKKLLYNMYVAKATWLYNLEEWLDVLTVEEMMDVKKEYNVDHIAISKKIGRNEPCPCGSGKKYKKCCG